MPSRKAVKHTIPKPKFSFRRNLLPPLLGLVAALLIFGTLNSQWLLAQAQYRLYDPLPESYASTSAAAAAASQPDPAAAPELIIPKLSVRAPIIFESSYKESKVQLALRKGVVHYGTTAEPGKNGNSVIIGHSSGQLWAPGDYKFVFTLLDKLQPGDTVTINYKGTRYLYRVQGSKIVPPTDFSVLDQTSQPTLTLITCTPVGTSKNRLIVSALQIEPKPAAANTADSAGGHPSAPTPKLPGSASRSIWQTVRDWF